VAWNGHKIETAQEQPHQAAALAAPATPAQGAPRRDKQLNIKASDECKRVFAQIAQAQGLSAAALFEDMVAERADMLVRAGLLEG
jgi:hypothetical protein